MHGEQGVWCAQSQGGRRRDHPKARAIVVVCALGVTLSLTSGEQARADATRYRNAVIADAPWTFFEYEDPSATPGATATDSSGNGHNGKYAPAFGQPSIDLNPLGKFGKAMHLTTLGYAGFDGANNFGPAATSFTFETWFRTGPGQSGSLPDLLILGSITGGSAFTVRLSGGSNPGKVEIFSPLDYTGSQILGRRIDDGLWHHVAITRTSTRTLTVYEDGVNAGSWSPLKSGFASSYNGGALTFGNCCGSSSGVEFYEDETAFYTKALGSGALLSHFSQTDDSAPQMTLSLPLWDDRNRVSDHRLEGIYASTADLKVDATDSQSGVASIEVRVDGVSQFSPSQTCFVGGCPMSAVYTFPSDDFTDGNHTVKAIVKDMGGNTTSQTWIVTVDRRGDIYDAPGYSADPATGGTLAQEEWGRVGSQTARVVEPETITTRSPVACDPAQPSGPQCGEVRQRSRDSESNPNASDDFTVYRGTSETDQRLPTIAGTLEPAGYTNAPTSSGPILSAAAPWQHLPPAHGDTYQLFEFSETERVDEPADGPSGETPGQQTITITNQTWVDATTKLPIKTIATTSDGQTYLQLFWTYGVDRKAAADYPSDFFLVARPQNVGQEKTVTYTGNDSVGPQQDRETSTSFTPYYLGASPALGAQTFCLATSSRGTLDESGPDSITTPEPGLGPDAFGPITSVDTAYNDLPSGASCAAGNGPLDAPSLEVHTAASASTVAGTWRAAYQREGTAIQANPLDPDFLNAGVASVMFGADAATVYVIPFHDGRSGALLERSGTTIVLTGPFTKNNVSQLLNSLQPR
jgi:hypothetical protein